MFVTNKELKELERLRKLNNSDYLPGTDVRRRLQRQWKVSIASLVLGVVLLVPQTSKALFGLGDIVFDPSSYAALGEIWNSDLSNGVKLEQTVQEAIKIYQNGKDIYELAYFMSQHLKDKHFMETLAIDAGQLYVQDNYGTNVNMTRVLNGDYQYGTQAGVAAWAKASSNSGDSGYLQNETPGTSARLARYATAALADSAAINCMQTVGMYRGYDPANRVAAFALKALHLDGNDEDNTQLIQQNINNGFAHQQLTEQQTANAFHACQAQMQMVNTKLQADNLKDEMSFEADIAHQRATNPDSLDSEDLVDFMKGR